MKLKQINVDGFGILNNLQIEFEPDLTIIYGLNGSGKSTLLNFIRSCFFGFSQRGSPLRYEALRGGKHGGTIRVSNQGIEYNISRTQDQKSAGALTIENLNSGVTLPADALTNLLGGISRSMFEMIFAFGLTELQHLKLLEDQELNTMLYSIGLGSTVPLNKINQKLIAQMDNIYKPRGKKPALNQVFDSRQTIIHQLKKSKQLTVEYGNLLQQINHYSATIKQTRDKLQKQQSDLHNLEMMLEVWPHWQQLVIVEEQQKQIPSRQLPPNGIEQVKELQAKLASLQDHRQQLKARLPEASVAATLESDQYYQVETRLEEFQQKAKSLETELHVGEAQLSQVKIEYNEAKHHLETLEQERETLIPDLKQDLEFSTRKHLFSELKRLYLQPTTAKKDIVTNLLIIVAIFGWIVVGSMFYFTQIPATWLTAGVLLILISLASSIVITKKRATKARKKQIDALKTQLNINNLEQEMGTWDECLVKEEALENSLTDQNRNLQQLRARLAAYEENLKQKKRQNEELKKAVEGLLLQFQLPTSLDLTDVQNYLEISKQLPLVLKKIDAFQSELNKIYHLCGTSDLNQITELYENQNRFQQLEQEKNNLKLVLKTYLGEGYGQVVNMIATISKDELINKHGKLELEVEATKNNLDELHHQLGGLHTQREQMEQSQEQEEYQLELKKLESQGHKLATTWASLKTLHWVIEQVSKEYEREKQPEVLQLASRYFAAITDNYYIRVYAPLGTKEIKIETKRGKVLTAHMLSRGTVEQLYLAIRFALANQVSQQRVGLPIFADDILVNFDRPRLLNTVNLIQEIAKNQQIVLLTCHKSIADLFAPQKVKHLNQKS